MSNSSTGQVLGAATVAGAVSVLPYTSGNVFLNLLTSAIKFGMLAVIVSIIISKLVIYFIKKQPAK